MDAYDVVEATSARKRVTRIDARSPNSWCSTFHATIEREAQIPLGINIRVK